MQPLDMVKNTGLTLLADVGTSQADNLAQSLCSSIPVSDMVAIGRTQEACPSQWGRRHESSWLATLQEYRSRGCRRARRSFWPCAWLVLLPPAQRRSKKKWFTLTSRFRPSPFTPANTSNLPGQAGLQMQLWPASYHSVGGCEQDARDAGKTFPSVETHSGGATFRRMMRLLARPALTRRSLQPC
jgi:hypothetical protein